MNGLPQNRPHNDISSPFVALVTDFGWQDSYVGEIQAVLLRRCPSARIIHITHDIPPGDIRAAAYVLGRSASVFPTGTIFLGVVDPGVGTDRPAVIVRTRGQFGVGPDNGIFARFVDWENPFAVRRIEKSDFNVKEISITFQGRDLFAPAAGDLALGHGFETIGKSTQFQNTFPPRLPQRTTQGWKGEIIYIDRFGNLATNLPNNLKGRIVYKGSRTLTPADSYLSIRDAIGWLKGSDGCIEIAGCQTSAAKILAAQRGDEVEIILEDIAV